MREREEK
jgi:hypothetical protein